MHAARKIDLGRFQDIETFTDTINPENMKDNYNNMSIIDTVFQIILYKLENTISASCYFQLTQRFAKIPLLLTM